MRSRRVRKIGLNGASRAVQPKTNEGSASASNSDSIEEEICVPSAPDREGQRQTRNAGLRGASIPCLQAPSKTQGFSFWNQPVPAICEVRLRQLILSSACPEEHRDGMTTTRLIPASHPYGALPGSLHTDNALFEAHPEV